jgi:methionyl-tRNA formyltransferase
MNRKLRIVYMGTPEFAVEPLHAILEAGYEVAAVITAPDKPSGRGQKLHASPVKEYAISHKLPVLQPVNLKNPEFISELKTFKANLQVVVAFRMLPEIVWQMPEYGTLNLHASLLPQYRGAAPINHAIINGESETGITTFFIEKEIDTGNIILAQKLPILPSDDAGTLHDRMMLSGGKLMVETLKMIETGNIKTQSQSNFIVSDKFITPAPKIFKNDCRIDWNKPCESIHNLVRGLSPFPGAFSILISDNNEPKQVKIYKTSCLAEKSELLPGTIITDNKKFLSVVTGDGILRIETLQFEGRKRMNADEYLRGFRLENNFHFE